MSQHQARPASLPWPPILYLGAVALAILLGVVLPVPWLSGPLAEFLVAVGALLVAAGLALIVLALRALSRAGTTPSPLRAATQLVTRGPYAISRNPIYLGNAVVMTGIALIAGNPWFIILALVASAATSWLAISGEEKHLELRFGRRYRDYAKKVRRWI